MAWTETYNGGPANFDGGSPMIRVLWMRGLTEYIDYV